MHCPSCCAWTPRARASRAGHLAAEVAADIPRQQVVLDRLLDWMLLCTLGEWFDRPDGEPPAWWAAQRDPAVGHALRLLHEEPAAPWTVSVLADRTGVWHSTLAKRFADLVGEPPLTYLTRWRMTLAAGLMIEQDAATLADITRAVGYSDVFGFSAAFKRIRGVNPIEFGARRPPPRPLPSGPFQPDHPGRPGGAPARATTDANRQPMQA